MKKSTLLSLIASISLAAATPVPELLKRADPSEVQILNYALTLEHLEHAFYVEFLAKYSAKDFEAAGFEDFVRGRLNQVGQHEAQHVQFLQSALGNAATKPCTYQFPVNNVNDFVAVSQVLEAVGVTAYLGAAQFLHTPSYLTAAGSILTTEARHNAWVNAVGLHSYPWSGPMDTPQTLNQVFSLAAPFIKSCPSSNPKLPVRAFPPLTATQNSGSSTVSLNYAGSTPSGHFLVLLHGLEITPVAINNGKATLPEGLQGTVYALVSKDKTANDNSTIAGPAIMSFPFLSFESNP